MRLMIDLEKSQTTKVTIMFNDRFEKAKNNPMVAIMLMIDVFRLKTTQHYSHVKWQISKKLKTTQYYN